ncbi:MAG: hypothetical protein P8H60_05855 [Schleiferiaceae bacterium]|nr:hypothetical protein [Schleiferiaceae bacterium]
MGLFERRQPRGFQHQPRFHDERKDRLRILERKEGIDEIPFQNKDKYRDRLRENWDLRRKRSAGASEDYGKRLLVSFLFLVVLVIVAVKFLA